MKNSIVRNKNENISYVSIASQYKKENLMMVLQPIFINCHQIYICICMCLCKYLSICIILLNKTYLVCTVFLGEKKRETGSQASFELMILLLQPLQSWDYRHTTSCMDLVMSFNKIESMDWKAAKDQNSVPLSVCH